ncbi:ATP phosphoribosyltransferase regulatory subunit [Methylophaga lonarensis]|uniref:ATP phosphoribosyltransferase regulatory subunit n=1 Tax=Methylophaga lonarensis TaxID=999151 RepID=UPI003D2B0987
MTNKESWLLPEGIDELMPDEAAQLEKLHRILIDKMQTWGYRIVVPPLVEYLDSLLTGTAKTLDIQTFKLIDQLTGRLMGIRADMTPQVARIAAHKLKHSGVVRLCYIGSVLHTLPEGQAKSRNPIQLGAEIFGHSGPESDMESIQLMVELLTLSGAVQTLSLDLGHVGIFRGLAEQAQLDEEQEQALFSALQRKADAEIRSLVSSFELNQDSHDMLIALAELNGGKDILARAQTVLKNAPAKVLEALNSLTRIGEMAEQRLPSVALNFDLAELRGYHYHTGIVFAAYQPGSAQAIALGGRYDDIGQDFGYGQPATGFSLDLKKLATQIPLDRQAQASVIYAPWSDDPSLVSTVESLRQNGEVVSYLFPDEANPSTGQKILSKQQGHWVVTETGMH